MKIEDISKLEFSESTQGFHLKWPGGLPHSVILAGYDFDTKDECRQVAALFRASHLMLEALETAVEAHEKALQITLNQIADAGNMVEHIGFPEWYEKAKAAIEAAKNTNERL